MSSKERETKIKPKSSSGLDGVSSRLLKNIFRAIQNPLLCIFNCSLSTGKFPSKWKYAKVKPLYKGKSKYEVINYRPISLLPVISEILEQLVQSRFESFLTKHRFWYDGQYGFRKNRSCNDAICDLIGNIVEGLDNKMTIITVFLDMSEAFNTIDRKVILAKL